MANRKKKKRNLGPRRKRMRRPARLQAAVKWRADADGSYREFVAEGFGPDWNPTR